MMLGDHYEVVQVLAGGMGEVFICDYVGDGVPEKRRRVALKTFQQRFFFDNAVRNAFVREASVWLRLTGLPHILPVYGIEQIERRPFIHMPAVPAENGVRTLADLIVRRGVDPLEALHFAFQVALGMQQAARQVVDLVHGDLKPANVLLMGGKAYVSDFGLATAATFGRADARLVGTPAYRAPELDGMNVAPTVASDVYAFGATLAEMMARFSPDNAVAAGALELARRCMAVDSLARPRDFAEVVARLSNLLDDHDPAASMMLMMDAMRYRDIFSDPGAAGLRVERIRSLVELGEIRQALEELDAIPREQYTPELWLRRAMALSIANRPEEAIEALAPVLEREAELEPRSRVLAWSEYALCLKRLGRFDEAERVYDTLLLEVDDEHLPIVLVNQASVYLQQHQPEKAVRLLEPFVRKRPEFAEAWANLGRAYMESGRHDEAEKAFGRSLQRDPSSGLVRVSLAELYMEHLRRIPEAWAALDAAFDAGHESREWLVRFLACSFLLKREETLASLKHALDHNFEKELADSMVRDAIEMAKRIAGLEDDGATAPVSAPEPRLPAPTPAAAAPPTRPDNAPDSRPGTPFINFRYYTTGDFTIDFYENPLNPDLVDNFVREWRRAMRDPNVQMQGASLRGSPFYFTRCPECGVHVVTNREAGFKLDCRMCDTRFFTSPIDEPSLNELSSRIEEITGIAAPEESAGGVHALFVQAASREEQGSADEICREAGMTLLPDDQHMAVMLLQQAVEHGACDLRRPWRSVWTMPAEPRRWSRTATPPGIDRVVRALQEALPGIRTMSSTLPAESLELLSGSVLEASARDEQEIREKLRRHDASAEEMRRLAEILLQRQEFNEAERIVRAALAADDRSADGWQILGWIHVRAGRFGAARAPLEHSLALDPARALNWRMLGVCCEKSGDDERAAEAYLRATAIMGNAEPPFPV
jgi:tetratricopeptide (TPR) repeat protein